MASMRLVSPGQPDRQSVRRARDNLAGLTASRRFVFTSSPRLRYAREPPQGASWRGSSSAGRAPYRVGPAS